MSNTQITDAVTQSNVKVVAEAPAMATASLYQTGSHSIGLLFENATNAQNQLNITAQSVTTQAVMNILSLNSTSVGNAPETESPVTEKIPAKAKENGISTNATK